MPLGLIELARISPEPLLMDLLDHPEGRLVLIEAKL
jgi:hypothetical protein